MRYIILIISVFLFGFKCIDNQNGGPKPPKKRYVDTIYAYRSKTFIAEENRKIEITGVIKKFKVSKKRQKLYAYFNDTFKVFKIALGGNPIGQKNMQGDLKTPEGKYVISFKNPKSRGYKSLKISYPNEEDKAKAQKLGINPGGDIFIHGLWWENQDPNTHWRSNWTLGCIALNNQQIEELYNHTELNTPIDIYP